MNEYGKVSDEILCDIAKACNVDARQFGTAEWVAKRLGQMGAFNQKEATRIKSIKPSTDYMGLAWATLMDIESEFPYSENVPTRDERVRLTVRAVENQTSAQYGALNATMLRSADQLYQNALNQIEQKMLIATEGIMVGKVTKQRVVKDVLKKIQEVGVTGFVDKSGRRWSAEAYADLVMRSTMGNVQRQIMIDRCIDYGEDIVYAPIKFPSRPLCADWQGKLLSISDRHYFVNDLYDRQMEVFPYSDAVGLPAGLWGCNCGHGKAVFIPNLSEVVTPVNNMTPKQNAEAYALTQQERQLERNVRNCKTQIKMLEQAGVTGDEMTDAVNQLKRARANYKGFLDAYGYDPTAGRTYVQGFKMPTQPKPPKSGSPSQNGFTLAKDIQDAQTYGKKFANTVEYGHLTLKQANAVNETLTELTTKYPINKLAVIGKVNSDAFANANFRSLNTNSTIGENTAQWFANRQARRKKNIEEAEAFWAKDKYPMPKERRKELDAEKGKLNFTRWHISETYAGKEVEITIMHEYGHIIADQYFGQFNYGWANPHFRTDPELKKMANKWVSAYKKARKTGDIYKISEYADSQTAEFFAECFAMREVGETLPDYIENLMKEVLDNGIM